MCLCDRNYQMMSIQKKIIKKDIYDKMKKNNDFYNKIIDREEKYMIDRIRKKFKRFCIHTKQLIQEFEPRISIRHEYPKNGELHLISFVDVLD